MQRERAREVNYDEPAEYESNPAKFFLTAASLMINETLNIARTDDTPERAIHREERLLCGRWLACQRARCELSNVRVEREIGVDAETLLRLELGVLNDDSLDDKALTHLCEAIRGQNATAEFAMAVAQVAAGQTVATEEIMDRVVRAINIADDRQDV